MNTTSRLSLVLAAAGLVGVFSTPAHALLQVAADINGVTFTCFDQQASCDTNTHVGVLQVPTGLFAGVQLNDSLQTSVGTVLTSGVPTLNTGSFSIINTNGVPVTITISVGDINFLGPANRFAFSGSGTWQDGPFGQPVAGSSITMQWFDDPANAQGAGTPFSAPGNVLGTFSETAIGAADSFSNSVAGFVSDPGNFSMTETAVIHLMPGAELVSRGQTELKTFVIPEPSTWAMMVLGFAGLAYAGLRRKRTGRLAI